MINNIRTIALLLVVITCNIVVQAQSFEKGKLDQYFQELNNNDKFMGNVSIFRDGIEVYSKSVGYADIDTQVLNTESSKSCVGSISKTFTAVMTFQAIEAGKLSLSETIDKYFPTIKNAERITIEQLLGHRSGIHNYTENLDFMQWTAKTRGQMIEIIMAGGSDFEPDTNADYCNSGYVLLSYILEDVYGKSYADILANNIIRPIFLENTYFGREAIDINNNESNSYLYSNKWQIQTVTDPSVTLGAGCIISTPNDLNKFADALFNGKLVSASSFSTMQNVREDFGGMGLFPIPYFSRQGYGHRGGVDGFNSMLIYMPEDNISYAITSNGLNYNFTEIHLAVLNCIYGQQIDIPIFNEIVIEPEILDKYIGVYTNSKLPLKVTITNNNNSLFVQGIGESTFQIEPASEHIFKFTQNNIVIEFNPTKTTMVLIQGEEIFYFEKK